MEERPIIFSGPMIRALLAGMKTQTRRVIKFPSAPNHLGTWEPATLGEPGVYLDVLHTRPAPVVACMTHTRTGRAITCPYGSPGDSLWVREKFAHLPDEYEWAVSNSVPARKGGLWYAADNVVAGSPWRPSIHMPRWASRITLELLSVRPERLQEISEADAFAEGVTAEDSVPLGPAVSAYAALWDSINGKRHPWESNPFVWRLEFRRVAP
jgi:hypothetical protein